MKCDVVLIGNSSLGGPDQQLGRLLMGNFLRLLGGRDDLPSYVILWNSGVLLAANDSDVLDHLRKIEERGVKILLCRTCVEYFNLEDRVAAGEIEGMANILDILSMHQVMTV